MKRILTTLALLTLVSSCSRQDDDGTTLVKKEEYKPVVAIVPVINSIASNLPWDLSEEMTQELYHRLHQKDHVQLTRLEKVQSLVKKLKRANHPFTSDIAWVKPAFSGQDFVVFLELIEHEEIPANPHAAILENESAEFKMTVRVRVFDVRKDEPQIVLQELIHDSHHIPRPFNQFQFRQVPWGHQSFSISPMGLAHASLTKELASRIEDYILFTHGK